MKLNVIVVLCVGCLAAQAMSQPVTPAGGPEQYTGVVSGTDVYVRHNASMNAYPCTKLARPQQVTVVGSRSGWLEILPPPGVFSVVAKEYVKTGGDGTSGEMTGDNVWVRAGGDLRNTEFIGLLKQLKKGDKVSIIGQVKAPLHGEDVEYYKIVPPEGAHFWISELYVKPLNPDQPWPPKRSAAATAPTTAEVLPGLEALAAEPAPARSTAETFASLDQINEAMKQFRAAEKQLIDEFNKPAASREYQRVIDAFKAINAPADSRLQPYIDYYLQYIDFAMKKEAERAKVQSLVKDAASAQAEHDRRILEIVIAPTTMRSKEPLYAGQGVLGESAVYVGALGSPKRYLLRNERTGAVNAYVEPGPDVMLDRYLGRKVGVIGKSRFDREGMTEIILAEQVVVIEERPSLPSPPEPTIVPTSPPPPPSALSTRPSPPSEAPKPKAASAPAPATETPKPVKQTEGKVPPAAGQAAKPETPAGPPPAPAAEPTVKAEAAPPVATGAKAELPAAPEKANPAPAAGMPDFTGEPTAGPAEAVKPAPVTPSPKPPAKLAPPPAGAPKPAAATAMAPSPQPVKAIAVHSAETKPRPVTRPIVEPALPVVKLEPTTRPAATRPLAPSGLPVAQPATAGAINEQEYD